MKGMLFPPDTQERLSFARIDAKYRTIRTLIRCASMVLIAYFVYLAIKSLAGHDTSLSLLMSLLFDAIVDVKIVVAFTMAGACAVWAVAERALRHRKVDNLHGRIRELETQIDPGRTSSGLTTKGKTNPEDQRR